MILISEILTFIFDVMADKKLVLQIRNNILLSEKILFINTTQLFINTQLKNKSKAWLLLLKLWCISR